MLGVYCLIPAANAYRPYMDNMARVVGGKPSRVIYEVERRQVMREVMVADVHFGTIPGCGDKPSLLKPGAEKLGLTFRLAPQFEVIRRELGNHREYEIVCNLVHTPSGLVVGSGVGCCSTMEAKYRFRTESTGEPVPKEYWESRDRSLLGGPGYTAKKVKGSWFIVQRIEHDNPADYYNTVLKMAKKRAHVDAILTATAASDIFAQDLEELESNGVPVPEREAAAQKEPEEPPPPAEPVDDDRQATPEQIHVIRKIAEKINEGTQEDVEYRIEKGLTYRQAADLIRELQG